MDDTTKWLLTGPAYVQYRTRVDLLKQSESNAAVRAARQAMLTDQQVRALIDEASNLSKQVISSHKSAGHALHKLTFLADLGLRADDPGMKQVIAGIFKHQSTQGPFQVLMNVPVHFGGTGKDDFAWALCDAPLVVSALCKFGLGSDARVRRAVDYLTGLVRENGFPCAVSPELGKFRGPGRKEDPCPFANLAMLKVLAQNSQTRNSRASRLAVESILARWQNRRTEHPYMFYMGTDFNKLKAPLVWYDILHVLDVLTQFSWTRTDARLQSMLKIIQAKSVDGKFIPESIWTAWQDWEFGQKKLASYWVTFLAQRILKRANA